MRPLTKRHLDALEGYGNAKRRGDKEAMEKYAERLKHIVKDTATEKDVKK